MNIAIKGHKSRGKEVIQILESLGGENKWFHEGTNENCFYELHDDYIWCANTRSEHFKYYTLEEFEKEFPFKIGDKVIHKEFNDFFEVISFNPGSSYPYKIKGVCEFNTKSRVLTKWQPKMKEERFVTLTLDKAKEWYKKGGELKEIALQAFSEKELNVLPRSWEEFCRNNPVQVGECWLENCDKICKKELSTKEARIHKNWIPSRKSAEAHLAMIQLEQLRNCWRQGWKPEWNSSVKHAIKWSTDDLTVFTAKVMHSFLVFPTKEMAEEFLECFRDLIEKAGDLI